jgi:hypothetical protein
MLSKRYLYHAIIYTIVILFVILPVGKLVCYEYFTNISELRKNINKRVVYDIDNRTKIEGTLTKCHYKLNDSIGFFDVRVSIEGVKKTISVSNTFEEKLGISRSLGVIDIRKIKIQYDTR